MNLHLDIHISHVVFTGKRLNLQRKNTYDKNDSNLPFLFKIGILSLDLPLVVILIG